MPRQRKQQLAGNTTLYGSEEEVEVVQMLQKDIDKQLKPKSPKKTKLEEEEQINPVKHPKSRKEYTEQFMYDEIQYPNNHGVIDVIVEYPTVPPPVNPEIYLKAIETLSEKVSQLQDSMEETEKLRRNEHETTIEMLQGWRTELSELRQFIELESQRQANIPVTQENVTVFPIDSMERLKAFENIITNDKKIRTEMMATFEQGAKNKLQSLKKWISDDVIVRFNIKGRPGKGGSLKMENSLFLQMIGSAWDTKDFDIEDFHELLKKYRSQAKSRIEEQKKRRSTNGDLSDD